MDFLKYWSIVDSQDYISCGCTTSVQFSCSVMSNSLWPNGLQHTRPPCLLPTPRVYPLMPIESVMPSNHLILCLPLLLLPSIFPSIRSFQNSQLLASGGQSIGVSASASVLPMIIQDWLPLRLTGWISLQSKGLSRVFFSTTAQKHQFFDSQPSLWSNSHIPYMTTGKAIVLIIQTFAGKVMSQWNVIQ